MWRNPLSGKEKKNGSNSLPKKSKLSRQGGRAGRNPSQWCLRRDVRRQSNFQAYKRQSLELFCYLSAVSESPGIDGSGCWSALKAPLVSLKCLRRGAEDEEDQGSAVGTGRDERMGWTSLRRAQKELLSRYLWHTLVGRGLSKHKCTLWFLNAASLRTTPSLLHSVSKI